MRPDLAVAVSLVLAAVFAAAAVAKLRNLRAFRESVVAFGVPAASAPGVSGAVVVAELGVAALLVSPALARWGGAAGLALVYLFSLIVLVALALGRRPACRCFGSVRSAPVGPRTLGRNLGLAVAAAYVAAPLLRGNILELALLAITGVAAALGLVIVQLRRQLDRPAPPAVAADPLVGTPAPPFDLAAAAAGRVSLTSLLETGKPALLLFMGVNCQVCHRMIPTVKRWHAEHAGAVTVAVVMRDSLAANMMFDSGGPDVLLQAREEVSEAYGVSLTPAAVAISPDGTIASGIATGPDEIAALVARLTGR